MRKPLNSAWYDGDAYLTSPPENGAGTALTMANALRDRRSEVQIITLTRTADDKAEARRARKPASFDEAASFCVGTP